MAILALTPLWIGSAFTGIILRCRDLHTVSKYLQFTDTMFIINIDDYLQIAFFAGTLLCEALNMFLKYSIREPRPATRNSYYGEL